MSIIFSEVVESHHFLLIIFLQGLIQVFSVVKPALVKFSPHLGGLYQLVAYFCESSSSSVALLVLGHADVGNIGEVAFLAQVQLLEIFH